VVSQVAGKTVRFVFSPEESIVVDWDCPARDSTPIRVSFTAQGSTVKAFMAVASAMDLVDALSKAAEEAVDVGCPVSAPVVHEPS